MPGYEGISTGYDGINVGVRRVLVPRYEVIRCRGTRLLDARVLDAGVRRVLVPRYEVIRCRGTRGY